jgi:hypothetical protein
LGFRGEDTSFSDSADTSTCIHSHSLCSLREWLGQLAKARAVQGVCQHHMICSHRHQHCCLASMCFWMCSCIMATTAWLWLHALPAMCFLMVHASIQQSATEPASSQIRALRSAYSHLPAYQMPAPSVLLVFEPWQPYTHR